MSTSRNNHFDRLVVWRVVSGLFDQALSRQHFQSSIINDQRQHHHAPTADTRNQQGTNRDILASLDQYRVDSSILASLTSRHHI
jgi:hypothetical protein